MLRRIIQNSLMRRIRMIVKKCWDSKSGHTFKSMLTGDTWVPDYTYTGWFLFGIIPLYIIRE
jgi:hypothetical protein